MTTIRFPSLSVQRRKDGPGRLFVNIPGTKPRKRKSYGAENDPDAVARYNADRRRWQLEHGAPPEDAPPVEAAPRNYGEKVLIADLVDAFMKYAREHYVKHGRPTGTAENYFNALEPVLLSYGHLYTCDFTLDRLEELQHTLDKSKRFCRRQVNKRIQSVCYVFTWGTRHRLNGVRYVPAEIAAELRLIAPLRAGYAESKDHPRKLAVPPADVVAVLQHLTPTVADMVRLQVLTGARPQEVRLMRAGDFETVDNGLWYYRPSEYKTEHTDGGGKIISIGPKAIAILKKRLRGKKAGAYIFTPEGADAEHRKRAAKRVKHKTPSRLARDEKRANNPRRVFNACYEHYTYSNAIKRACRRAGVKVWTPYQLRKLRGTEVDRVFGAEAAQAVLGHKCVTTTLTHYIDPHRQQADEIARKFG